MRSRIILTVFLLILLPALCTAQTLLSGTSSWPVASGSDTDIPKGTYLLRDEDTVSFKEVWGFVNQWSVSSTWNKDMPVTDSGAGAWTYPGINRILQDEEIPEVTYDKGFPTFSYRTEVSVTGYYNDAWSVFMLSKQYEQTGISSVGFWRIGQEDPSFWEHLNITPEGN